jgi:hypothetical protein
VRIRGEMEDRLISDHNLITYCKNCHMYKIHNFGNN